MSKRLGNITMEDLQIANKYIKIGSSSLIIREMSIKITDIPLQTH